MSERDIAKLYRMVLPDHVCPFGVRAKQLLEAHGYEIEDHLLRSRDEVDSFKDTHSVSTTPLIFIGDERIGDSEELSIYLTKR